ncbi:MAG TPA: hypothetical protein VLG11_04790 [Candidatus Saccharimonadales bacterium]|nr:hypothetical protein [Candidatus Saccharimonadales bacterium]
MSTRDSFVKRSFAAVRRASKRPRFVFAAIFVLLLLVHAFIFRSVLADVPAIMHGHASVVREELVPFFDFHSEYLPAESSALTGSNEFRVTYSFWTAWMRYNPILPFAIVIISALSAYLLFYAFYRVVRRFSEGAPKRAIFVSLLSALVIHFVLLYSKVADFYTLIIGFSMFALTISLAIEQFFFNEKLNWRNMAASSLLVLLNPAIHYHVLYYVVLAFLLVLQALAMLGRKHRVLAPLFKRNIWYSVIVGLASLVPYLLYIKLTAPPTSGIFDQAPVNYWMIYYSSLPLRYLFSLDGYGHVDFYRYGDYLAPLPRTIIVFIFIVVASIFTGVRWTKLETKKRVPLIALIAMLVLSMWMCIGYGDSSIFSFHQVLGAIVNTLSHYTNAAAEAAVKLIGIFINVLRFPHRFEFIVYYVVGLLSAIGLLWLFDAVRRREYRPGIAMLLTAIVAIGPFMLSTTYRQTFLTGDFNKFLTPYSIPEDLTTIKTTLKNTPGAKRVFVMPSMESGRELPQDGVNYTFLDKYYIYYLNQPTLYYGEGADTANKIVAFMVYRAIGYNQDWWENVLINDFGITNIVVPKNLHDRQQGITYLPGIDAKITDSLAHAQRFKKTFDGKDFAMYTATEKPNKTTMLADLSWGNLLKAFNSPAANLNGQQLDFPVQLKDFIANSGGNLMSDDPEQSFYDLYTAANHAGFTPTSSMLPFTDKLIASSNFTDSAFSMSTLYGANNTYNYTNEVVPSLLNLQTGRFIGVASGADSKVVTSVIVPKDGNYRLLAHAATNAGAVNLTSGGKTYSLQRLKGSPLPKGYIDFAYYKTDIYLKKGTYTFTLQDTSQTILLEQLGLIPAGDLPGNFGKFTQSNLSIMPADAPNMYTVHVQSNGKQK